MRGISPTSMSRPVSEGPDRALPSQAWSAIASDRRLTPDEDRLADCDHVASKPVGLPRGPHLPRQRSRHGIQYLPTATLHARELGSRHMPQLSFGSRTRRPTLYRQRVPVTVGQRKHQLSAVRLEMTQHAGPSAANATERAIWSVGGRDQAGAVPCLPGLNDCVRAIH